MSKVGKIIEAAARPCDQEYPYHDDGAIFNLLESPDKTESSGVILKLMYYRGRQQSAMWDLFWILCESGVTNANVCLREPICWDRTSPGK